jgi:hypothetical protein
MPYPTDVPAVTGSRLVSSTLPFDVEHRDRAPETTGDMTSTAASGRRTGTATTDTTARGDLASERAVQLREEELRVRKEPVQTGHGTGRQ